LARPYIWRLIVFTVTWNLAALLILSRHTTNWGDFLERAVSRARWLALTRHARAVEWLQVWSDLGRAPRTIDAYSRCLAEYLVMCERVGVDPLIAGRAHSRAKCVSWLRDRAGAVPTWCRSTGVGLANATLQQRLVPVRLFYDFLIEEGPRESNPVGRGRFTPARGPAGVRMAWCRR
jgi:integrase/recombinase XerD